MRRDVEFYALCHARSHFVVSQRLKVPLRCPGARRQSTTMMTAVNNRQYTEAILLDDLGVSCGVVWHCPAEGRRTAAMPVVLPYNTHSCTHTCVHSRTDARTHPKPAAACITRMRVHIQSTPQEGQCMHELKYIKGNYIYKGRIPNYGHSSIFHLLLDPTLLRNQRNSRKRFLFFFRKGI